MKKYLAILLLNCVLGYILFVPSQRSAGEEISNQNGIPASIGKEDNPRARFLQEFMMLRDPVTNEIPKNIFRLEREFAKTLPKRENLFLNKNSSSNETQALTWTARGPNNVGGRTRALGIDKRTGNPPDVIILAGGVSGGIWRSTNDGSTWSSVTSPSQLHSVTCIVQDKRSAKEDIWYAGTGEAVGNSASGSSASTFRGDGIFKSTDNGLTWNIIPSTSTSTPQSYDQVFDYVHNIAIDTSNNLYVAASNTIQRTTDGGENWSTVLGSFPGSSFISDVQVTTGGVVYAAISKYPNNTDKGIWRSPDGVTWTNISDGISGFPTTQFGRITIGIALSDEDVVYFLIEYSDNAPATNGHQLWKYTYGSGNGSGNKGTWVNRGGNLPDELEGSGLGGNDPFDTQGGYDMYVQVSPTDKDFVIAASTNLYTSTDGFATTTNYDRVGGYAGPDTYAFYTNHHPDLHSGAFLPGSNIIYYSGSDGGVHKTSDIKAGTVSWTSLNTGYNTSQFYSLSLAPESGSNVMMGGTQDNGTWLGTSSGLSSWTSVEGGDGTIVEVAPIADDKIYTAYQVGGLRRRTRAGTFLADFTPTPSSSLNQLFVNPLVLDPNNSGLMYYAGGTTSTNTGILRCNPKTATSSDWTNLSSTIVSSDQVSAIGISTASSANVLYYGTKNGVVKRVDGANSGSEPTVTNISSGLPDSGYVNCLAVDPTNSDNVIAVFSNYNFQSLWYSTNGGSSWTDVEGNLSGATGPSVRWTTIFYVSGESHYFLGTSVGVYFTNTLGGSTVWTQEAVGSIGNAVTVMLDWRDNDGTLAAATHGKGVYTTQITSPLPVELSAFSGIYQDGSVKLLWRTETEVNNYGFEILRFAQNGGHSEPDLSGEESWEKIGFIEGHGNSNSPKSYEFVDESVMYGTQYYRLKQIDNDGSFEYSDVVEVDVPTLQDYAILEQNYPNPFNPETKIRFVVNENTQVTLKVFDEIGSEIAEIFNDKVESGRIYEVNFNGLYLSSGVYFYSLISEKTRKTKKMLLIK